MSNKSRSLCSRRILEFKRYDFVYLSDNYYDKLHFQQKNSLNNQAVPLPEKC